MQQLISYESGKQCRLIYNQNRERSWPKMGDEIVLFQFEELAEQLGILVRDESINLEESFSKGGLCRVEGKYILILNSKATVKEKIQVMVRALQQFNLEDIYVKPVLRELLEGYNDYGGET